MKFLNRVLPYDGLPSGTRLGAFGVSVADQFIWNTFNKLLDRPNEGVHQFHNFRNWLR